MAKIIGNTTATPVPRSNWVQTDESKVDFILNKPELGALAAKDTVAKDDLAADVQASLEKADSAIQNLDGYATESYVSEALESKADADHNHDNAYDAKGAADVALDTAKAYTDVRFANLVFIGTYAEYQTALANNQIPVNTFVIITDDESSGGGGGSDSGGSDNDDPTSSTTAMLGYAVLGQMVLG